MSDVGVEELRMFLMAACPDPSPEGDDALVVETGSGEFRITVARTSADEVVTAAGPDDAYRRRRNKLLHGLGYGGDGLLLVPQAQELVDEFVAAEVGRVRRREMNEALGDHR